MAHKIVGTCGNDSDSMEEDLEMIPKSEIEKYRKANEAKKLTPDEIKMLKTYTYDPEPVKAWREINDYMAIKECNAILWSKICEQLNIKEEFEFFNSLTLYRNRHSEIVHTVLRILCPKQCYFFPEKCLFSHGYDFKNLLRKDLHERFNPAFENLFKINKNKKVELERLSFGPPNMIKLAEDIGINSVLNYDEHGFLQVDISVFEEKFWNEERPCFVKEEKKVLDTLYALLIVSSDKMKMEISIASKIYAQKEQGINDPIFKTLCKGPIPMSNARDKDHWEFVHYDEDGTNPHPHCEDKEDINLEGPASTQDTAVIYPCNLKKCRLRCMCLFCQQVRQLKCHNHKKHIKHNMKICKIQELVNCQEHWLDHPKNFETDTDIKVDHHKIYCDGEVREHGRNELYMTTLYPGLKRSCRNCIKNVKDHLSEHLVPHLQCKLCLYDLKTSGDSQFWEKVCHICGKVFESENEKAQHVSRHEVSGYTCDICTLICSTKFTLHRHMVEQHGILKLHDSSDNVQNEFECGICEKSYKYKRNLNEHIKNSHTDVQKSQLLCNVCGSEFTVKSSLKVHMAEQHGIREFDGNILSKEIKTLSCTVCEMVFRKTSNLKAHELTHIEHIKFECDQCGKQFTAKTSLNRHKKVHMPAVPKYLCDLCNKSFLSQGSLGRHRNGVHKL